MKPITDFSSGTIAIACNAAARYTDFCVSISRTRVPPGSVTVWSQGFDVASGLNDVVRNMHGEWLWIMGDDHLFDADLLHRLLDRDNDIIVPLCTRRKVPFDVFIYDDFIPNEGYHIVDLDLIQDEVIEIEAAGSAGMLIKRHVLEALNDPWFINGHLLDDIRLPEDLYFCHTARAAGFKIHCDLTAPLGHIRPISISAVKKNDQWGRLLDLGDDNTIFIPTGGEG